MSKFGDKSLNVIAPLWCCKTLNPEEIQIEILNTTAGKKELFS
jgi:hypothetical protein